MAKHLVSPRRSTRRSTNVRRPKAKSGRRSVKKSKKKKNENIGLGGLIEELETEFGT